MTPYAASAVEPPSAARQHESSRGLALGPPKTVESARTITLPPFLVELLHAYLAAHDHPHVFVSPDRQLYRRSNFSRRALRPAADGAPRRRDPDLRLPAVKPGLTFHGLRHSHKTWMIADNVPEIAQARRLGHILDDKIRQTYSHVAAEVEHRLASRRAAGPLGQSRRRQPPPTRLAGHSPVPIRARPALRP